MKERPYSQVITFVIDKARASERKSSQIWLRKPKGWEDRKKLQDAISATYRDVENFIHGFGLYHMKDSYTSEPTPRSDWDNNPICYSCMIGNHPHGYDKNSDCKVLLTAGGKRNGNQCCCKWRQKE